MWLEIDPYLQRLSFQLQVFTPHSSMSLRTIVKKDNFCILNTYVEVYTIRSDMKNISERSKQWPATSKESLISKWYEILQRLSPLARCMTLTASTIQIEFMT